MANTIQDKLAYLEETKGLIKEAIIAKGVEVTDTDTFRSYANKIEAIQSGGSIAGAPSGIKFGNSTFTTVPTEILPYIEQQTDLSNMFSYCGSLETVPLFDTSQCTNMKRMFESCSLLKTVPLLNTSSLNNMSLMFSYCRSLETVPQFDTRKVVYMYSTFNSCSSLKTVPLLDINNVTNTNAMFSDCTSLTNLGGFIGLKENLNLSYSYELTVDSVMNVINYAADMTSSPKTLILKQFLFNKLSEEQIATASAKGWNIAAG